MAIMRGSTQTIYLPGSAASILHWTRMAHSHSHGHSHHGHAHGHSHAHGHEHGDQTNAASTRALAWALGLTFVILLAEGIGGWMSNSLALLADAGHVLTDAGALGLSLFVAWLARQPGSAAKTFGYLRWEILAALINGATLLVISSSKRCFGSSTPSRSPAG